MRIIKFRAKRKLNGEWVYGSYIQEPGLDDWCHIVPVGTEYDEMDAGKMRVITSTVGQWTGFQINNIDLYEGDIIRQEIAGEQGDERSHLVVTWIAEWGLFGALNIEEGEYKLYREHGAEELDETMFWTFPIEVSNEHVTIAIESNIHDKPNFIL